MLREIRGVDQRQPAHLKRWFQDDFFDLFVWQDRAADVVRFQLCYERDTQRERALEWRRGRGFQHHQVRQRYDESRGAEQSGDMEVGGVLPYLLVRDKFENAAGGVPPALHRFIMEKLSEYARPSRRFLRPGARVPRWLERLRRREGQDSSGETG